MSPRNRIQLDAYVVDTLMRDLVGHDRQPSAFIVYLLIWRRLAGSQRERVHLSHQAIADATGLSKSAVQGAVTTLVRRKLITARRARPTSTPEYRLHVHWRD